MAREWETWLRNSIGPASTTEEADRDRTESRIRQAIAADHRLANDVRVFVKGSYANNTNVRRDSDVDVAVEWRSWAYVTKSNEASKLSWDALGVTLGDSPPQPREYREWVEAALVNAFGGSVDTNGKSAITVAGSSTTLDADVVPCFRLKRYDRPGKEPHVGIRLHRTTGENVENWPAQNYANGASKNLRTGRRFKEIVRALKRLENDMVRSGYLDNEIHGFFIECLLYNLPDQVFKGSTYRGTTLAVLAEMWQAIKDGDHVDWVETNALKWLWRSGQTWTPEEASKFAYAAWNYVNGD